MRRLSEPQQKYTAAGTKWDFSNRFDFIPYLGLNMRANNFCGVAMKRKK